MNPVVHFEMPYNDRDRLAKFYQAAFGWKMKTTGEEMGHYVLATTSPSGKDGTPKQAGRINGGFFARNSEMPDQYPSVVIAVDDIKAAMDGVRKAGGEVMGEPMDIPGIGAYVSFRDSEGNRVGMLEPLPMPKPKAKAKPAKKRPAVKRRSAKKARKS